MRALVLVVCLLSGSALADGAMLERARRLYADLRYDEAAALLEGALDEGALSGDERREALLLAGIVEVIRGNDAGARTHFRTLLEEAPGTTLPSGLSPKITRVFEEVKELVAAEPPPDPPLLEPPSSTSEEAAAAEAPRADPAPSVGASPTSTVPQRADEGERVSPLVIGVAAGAAVAAVVVVVSASALFYFARAQPPESSLGTMQLP